MFKTLFGGKDGIFRGADDTEEQLRIVTHTDRDGEKLYEYVRDGNKVEEGYSLEDIAKNNNLDIEYED